MTTTQPTQDITMSPDERAVELLARSNVREKASLMFQTITSLGPIDEPGFFPLSTKSLIDKGVTHFNLHESADPARVMAEHHNALQQVALSVNAKIPFTLSSDPRHAFTHNPLASMYTGCFSQ
jgi:beta-glucosidase